MTPAARQRTARIPAYAKLNLGLRVLYKRPDGYHELRTVFQTISLADQIQISFTPARVSSIEVHGTPSITGNLAEKAALQVIEATGIQGEIVFHLRKNIPMGAGLGGGSSDAAAVLIALPVLTGKPLATGDLETIAARLGSDVPFFLHGGTALGLGRGEELYPLPDQPRARGLLVVPNIHSSTAEAYRDLSETLTSIALQNKLSSFQREVWQGAGGSVAGGAGTAEGAGNDFEEVVFARHPELKEIKERLLKFGAEPAAMTGSGSGVFGLFRDPKDLHRAQKFIAGNSSTEQRVLPITFISRAQYRSAWKRALKLHVEGTLWPPRSRYARNQSAR